MHYGDLQPTGAYPQIAAALCIVEQWTINIGIITDYANPITHGTMKGGLKKFDGSSAAQIAKAKKTSLRRSSLTSRSTTSNEILHTTKNSFAKTKPRFEPGAA